jgi:hypothetical protein
VIGMNNFIVLYLNADESNIEAITVRLESSVKYCPSLYRLIDTLLKPDSQRALEEISRTHKRGIL